MALNGQQIGAQNVEKLRRFLEENAGNLPMFNGRLNKSKIAVLAGLSDRQVFENNPAAKALLEEYGEAARLSRRSTSSPGDTDALAMEKIRQLEAEVSRFRSLAAKRAIELEKRRQEAAESEMQLRVFQTMMETMRSPVMPPHKEGAA